MSKWETVRFTYPGESVYRFPVPGGWVYQVRGEITFVPEPVPKVTITHKIGDLRRSVTGPITLLPEDMLPLGDTAAPVPDQVVIGAEVLSDLVKATTRLLRGVEHHDRTGFLIHECDVVHAALNKFPNHVGPVGRQVEELSEAPVG